MDLGAIAIPLGTTNGTTNAVVFGMGLMDQRDEQLNGILVPPKSFTHHDMDAPPWWYFYKRPSMYIDGFAEKGHRGLMQFTLVPENGPDFIADMKKTSAMCCPISRRCVPRSIPMWSISHWPRTESSYSTQTAPNVMERTSPTGRTQTDVCRLMRLAPIPCVSRL